MPASLPHDAAMQAYITERVTAADDISLLSRGLLKDGLVDTFALTSEQRRELDGNARYKTLIKAWIQEAVDRRPDEEAPGDAEDRENDAQSDFSSLDDDDGVEPARKRAKRDSSEGARARKASASAPSDGGELRLKKLKGYVLLCGTRKPWKRLFEDAGCPDEGAADETSKKRIRKRQAAVVEEVLLGLGMTAPYSKAKAAKIKEEREFKQDLEAIQAANQTERSSTRGRMKRTASSSPDEAAPAEAPETKKFSRSLADFAAELND